MIATVTLILGGARSGKSEWAERLAAHTGRPVIFVATAVAGDAEIARRIAAHRAARPSSWRTIEAPDGLAGAIGENTQTGDVVVVDCLTLWVSNVLLRRIADDRDVETVTAEEWEELEVGLLAAVDDLLATARALGVSLILVSNEVGLGIVPVYPLGRRYRDVLGRINRGVARQADSVLLIVAGLPVDVRRLVPDALRSLVDWPANQADGTS